MAACTSQQRRLRRRKVRPARRAFYANFLLEFMAQSHSSIRFCLRHLLDDGCEKAEAVLKLKWTASVLAWVIRHCRDALLDIVYFPLFIFCWHLSEIKFQNSGHGFFPEISLEGKCWYRIVLLSKQSCKWDLSTFSSGSPLLTCHSGRPLLLYQTGSTINKQRSSKQYLFVFKASHRCPCQASSQFVAARVSKELFSQQQCYTRRVQNADGRSLVEHGIPALVMQFLRFSWDSLRIPPALVPYLLRLTYPILSYCARCLGNFACRLSTFANYCCSRPSDLWKFRHRIM